MFTLVFPILGHVIYACSRMFCYLSCMVLVDKCKEEVGSSCWSIVATSICVCMRRCTQDQQVWGSIPTAGQV